MAATSGRTGRGRKDARWTAYDSNASSMARDASTNCAGRRKHADWWPRHGLQTTRSTGSSHDCAAGSRPFAPAGRIGVRPARRSATAGPSRPRGTMAADANAPRWRPFYNHDASRTRRPAHPARGGRGAADRPANRTAGRIGSRSRLRPRQPFTRSPHRSDVPARGALYRGAVGASPPRGGGGLRRRRAPDPRPRRGAPGWRCRFRAAPTDYLVHPGWGRQRTRRAESGPRLTAFGGTIGGKQNMCSDSTGMAARRIRTATRHGCDARNAGPILVSRHEGAEGP